MKAMRVVTLILLLFARAAFGEPYENVGAPAIDAPPPIVWLDSECERLRMSSVTNMGLPYASVLAQPMSAATLTALNRGYEELSAFQSRWVTCRLAEQNFVISWLQSGGVEAPSPAQQAYGEAIAALRALSPQSLPAAADPFEASLYSIVDSDYRNVLAQLRAQPLMENVERLKEDIRDDAHLKLQNTRKCLVTVRESGDSSCYSDLAAASLTFSKSFADKVAIYSPVVALYADYLKSLSDEKQSIILALERYKGALASDQQAAMLWQAHIVGLHQVASYYANLFYWAWGLAGYYYNVGNPWAGNAWFGAALSFLHVYNWIAYYAIPGAQSVLTGLQTQIARFTQEIATLQASNMGTVEKIQETKQELTSLVLTY